MKVLRKIVEIDDELCDGCGQCVPACAEGAIQIIDGKARLVEDRFCDGLGACLGDCPNGALRVIEREAEDFDEEAVEEHLSRLEKEEDEPGDIPMACGCPSTLMKTFQPAPGAAGESGGESSPSALSHWPVQIRLVPPHAPFLKGADLLVAADCTPFAYADFHRDFIRGKTVLVGCPKFDDVEEYLARFEAIFRNAGIRSVTAVTMEVPCCSALPGLLKKAMQRAGVDVPLELVVIGSQGGVVERSAA